MRRAIVGFVILAAALVTAPALAAAGPATPNPMRPHLDTWNPKRITGPNRIDMLVEFPDAESTFMDRGGRACAAPNREVVSYAERLHPVLAHGSDAELARFLPERCGPEFDVAPLHGSSRRVDVSILEPPSAVPPPPQRPHAPR